MRKAVPILELSDYWEILRRRQWVVLVCLLIGLVGAGIVFLVMPKTYRSSTLILVESQKVPTEYIKPVVVDTIEERLITIQQQIFSRTLLQKIIEEFGLYKDELKRDPLEDVIEEMRKNIKVSTVDDRLHRNIQAFTLAFDGENPLTVMQVTNKLAALFIEENLKVREQLVEGTSEFLEHELRNVKEKLERQEAEISEYKQKYMGRLPQQAEANLRTLDRLQMELQNAADSLRIAEERREILREAVEESGGEVPGPDAAQSAPLKARLQQLRQQLVQLQAEYTGSYPDVIQAKRQIHELEEQLAGKSPRSETTGNEKADSVVADGAGGIGGNKNLTTHLRAIEPEIEIRKQRKHRLEKQIKEFESRIESTPIHEQRLSILLRDYEQNRKSYQTLLEKKMAATISENLEKRQKGEQFRIVDPANLPEKPVKPDPLKVFLGGVLAGLVLGGGSIWWLDFRNLPFRRPEEVETAVGLPILATIPHVFSLQEASDGPKPSPAITKERWVKRWLKRCLALPVKLARRLRVFLPQRLKAEKRAEARRALQTQMNALGAEQFRVLAGRIVQLREKNDLRLIAVTSSLAGEGKTMVALNLALTLAKDYLEDTVLIDGDIRTSDASTRLGLQGEMGMINVLAGECELEKALLPHAYPNLKVLTAGKGTRGLTATRERLQMLLNSLKQRGLFVILDTPPILPMADMNLYAEIVDGIVLVVKAGQVSQQVVGQALKFLSSGNIVGVVLNDLLTPRLVSYYGHYKYMAPEKAAVTFQP